MAQDRAGAVDQQAAQVRVAGLGDAQQSPVLAAGVLAGNQAEPSGGLTAVLEGARVGHFGGKGGRDEGTDAAVAHQLLTAWAVPSELFEIAGYSLQPLVELLQVDQLLAQGPLQQGGQALLVQQAAQL